MSNTRLVIFGFVVAFALVPLSARAQTVEQRLRALERQVGRLQENLQEERERRRTRDQRIATRLDKLEGNIAEADLEGSYNAVGVITDLDADPNPASVAIISLSAVLTLQTGNVGFIQLSATGIDLVQGSPWTSGVSSFPPEVIPITWSYANGLLNISDGTPNLDISFNVGAGGRVLTYGGLSDDDTIDLIIATRLQ